MRKRCQACFAPGRPACSHPRPPLQIRTAFQTGVACVQCHPWCPDGIGMLDHISLRAGKPSAHIILKEEVDDAAIDLQWEAVSSYVDGLSPSQLNEHVPFAQHVRKFLLAKRK